LGKRLQLLAAYKTQKRKQEIINNFALPLLVPLSRIFGYSEKSVLNKKNFVLDIINLPFLKEPHKIKVIKSQRIFSEEFKHFSHLPFEFTAPFYLLKFS